MAESNDYVVGRGRLFFGQYKTGTRVAKGQRYFGNTPELSLAQSEELLDHYSAEEGVKVMDASVSLQNDSSGSFACDNISDENLALWFRGLVSSHIEAGSASATGTLTFATAVPIAGDDITINGVNIVFVAADPVGMEILIAATIAAQGTALANFINENSAALGVSATNVGAAVTVTANEPGTDGNAIALLKAFATPGNMALSGATLAGGSDVSEIITNVERGLWYQLGVTADTPQGVRNIGSVSIAGVADDSFTVENATGRIYLHPDADDISDGVTDLDIDYGVEAGVDTIVIAKGETIEGELNFISANAAGSQRDYFWPYVRLSPDGDFSLKGDDWQTMNFNFQILKRDSVTERQYITKR